VELGLNRYPSPQPEQLVARLASLYGVRREQLLVTRGSDEGIDLLLRVFCRPGRDAILECPPCFGMYRIAARIQGAAVEQVPRDPETLCIDHAALRSRIETMDDLKLLFLTSPNNPTGDCIGRPELLELLNACAGKALLVLDEAYIEFVDGGGDDDSSAVSLLEAHPELVVLRTLSKAWAAAGLRCGAVLAAPVVIDLLRRVMAPYPLTAPAIELALATTSTGARERQARMLTELAREKQALLSYLADRPWVSQLWSGQANFVLLRVADAPGLVAFCAERGVRIRDFSSQPLLEGCVRLSIGSRSDMQALRGVLDAWPAGPTGSE
jgi:histidinol-phosphate aminotransferase